MKSIELPFCLEGWSSERSTVSTQQKKTMSDTLAGLIVPVSSNPQIIH
jgi:hypothetical protein